MKLTKQKLEQLIMEMAFGPDSTRKDDFIKMFIEALSGLTNVSAMDFDDLEKLGQPGSFFDHYIEMFQSFKGEKFLRKFKYTPDLSTTQNEIYFDFEIISSPEIKRAIKQFVNDLKAGGARAPRNSFVEVTTEDNCLVRFQINPVTTYRKKIYRIRVNVIKFNRQ